MARPLKMKQIYDEIRDVAPFTDIPFSRVARIINNEIIDLASSMKLKSRTKKIKAVSGQMFYDIGDQGSELGVNKVFRVSFLDDDGRYILVPRRLDGEGALVYDET